jgi:hypothetical protein
MSNPPPTAPKGSLVAFVQGPTNLRFEVYKSSFHGQTEQQVLEKLNTLLAEDFRLFFDD